MNNKSLGAGERGASLVEYSLLLVLVALVALAAVAALGDGTRGEFDAVAAELSGTEPGGGQAQVPDESAGEEAAPADVDNGGEQGDESAQPGDQSAQPGGETDGSGDPVEVPAEPGSEVEATAGDSDWYWWDDRTDKGAWVGTISFDNEWKRHQYLTIEVTKTTANGKTIKETIRNFYVPANGSSDLQIWENDFTSNKHGTAQGNSVVSIEVTVTKIETSDENWQSKSFGTSGPTIGVVAPSTP